MLVLKRCLFWYASSFHSKLGARASEKAGVWVKQLTTELRQKKKKKKVSGAAMARTHGGYYGRYNGTIHRQWFLSWQCLLDNGAAYAPVAYKGQRDP